MKILLIDNYDSFTYNLAHYLEGSGAEVDIVLNDQINFENLNQFDKIVLSPGPGLPQNAGQLMELIRHTDQVTPILGVCLGFQALVEHFGGVLYNQPKVKHGVAEDALLNQSSKLFQGLPSVIKVGLYHSWAAKKEGFPKELQITASLSNETIMGFEHRSLPVCGLQFHPESVLTDQGKQIIKNFLDNF